MTSSTDLEETIRQGTANPRRATIDGNSAEQQSLRDQIEADFAAVIQSQGPADTGTGAVGSVGGEDLVAPEPMDVFELARRMVTVMPEGYQLGQIRTATAGECTPGRWSENELHARATARRPAGRPSGPLVVPAM